MPRCSCCFGRRQEFSPLPPPRTLSRRREYTRAIPRFAFIRDAFPQHVTPSFALGQIYREQGDYARAEAEFVRVLDLPDSRANLKLDRRKIAIQRALAFRFLAELRRRE